MKPVYLLTGTNAVFKRDYERDLIKEIPKDEVTLYNADETEAGVIFSQCYQNQLFGGNNVVIVRYISNLKDSAKKAFQASFENYLSSVNTDTQLILDWDKPPAKLADAVKKNKLCITKNFKTIYHNDLLHYAREQFISYGITFDESILDFILDITHDDIEEVSMVCKMLIDYAGKERQLSLKDAKNVLSRSHNLSIFDFLNGFFSKNIIKAMESLNDLRLNGESPIKINFMILKTARNLWGYLTMKRQPDLTKKLGISGYQLKILIDYARHVNLKFVSSVIEFCKDMEYISKSSSEDIAFTEIEKFILTMEG